MAWKRRSEQQRQVDEQDPRQRDQLEDCGHQPAVRGARADERGSAAQDQDRQPGDRPQHPQRHAWNRLGRYRVIQVEVDERSKPGQLDHHEHSQRRSVPTEKTPLAATGVPDQRQGGMQLEHGCEREPDRTPAAG